MHNDYKIFLAQKRPSIVEVFSGYLPPTAKAAAAKPLPSAFETIAVVQPRSLQLIPSRFDFRITCWALCDPTRKRLPDI